MVDRDNEPLRDSTGKEVFQGVAPVLAAGYIGASLASSIGGWMVDLFRGVVAIAKGTGSSKMAQLDRRMAVADMVAIAALADERIDDQEQHVIASLVKDDPELSGEINDALDRWRKSPAILTDSTARVRALRDAAARMGEDDRANLRELVEALPAPPQVAEPGGPYRATAEEGRTLREEVLRALAPSG